MAGWLDDQSPFPVRLVRDGEMPTPGVALLAGTNDHLILTNSAQLRYVREPAAALYRPSVDVFFRSIPSHWNGAVVAVLLTGMGRDGAAGMKFLRDAGALTIAQDKASSTVYGMPKAAAELEAASEILSLDAIGLRLAEVADGGVVPTLRRHPHD
jgi:two-component system response regulator WspF